MAEKGEHVKFESFLAVILSISVSYFIDVIANEDKKTHRCDCVSAVAEYRIVIRKRGKDA